MTGPASDCCCDEAARPVGAPAVRQVCPGAGNVSPMTLLPSSIRDWTAEGLRLPFLGDSTKRTVRSRDANPTRTRAFVIDPPPPRSRLVSDYFPEIRN